MHVPSNLRVLIVEDEWLVAMEIEAAMLDAGYTVVGIAASAKEAISLAEETSPHVATMDVRLNGRRDGVDTALELRKRFGLRCLFVSAFSDAELKSRAEAANPLGWLQKPIAATDVVLALREAVRRLERE